MISFRYHIVSIVSVFLALAVGVALGGGPLNREVDNTLVEQVQADRARKAELQQEINTLASTNQFADEFAEAIAPGLVGGVLKGQVVSFVVLPGAQQTEVSELGEMVTVAGGSLGGTVRVGDGLLDVENRELVDELGSQLLDGASGVSVPADASGYERVGALLARATGTDEPGGASVDGTADSILAGLSTAGLLSAGDDLSRRGNLVVVVAGPGSGSQSEVQSASSIVTTMATALDAGTGGVVVAGPVAAARGEGVVRAIRDDVVAARDVSTVDVLGRAAARVVTVMALAGQAQGQTGHFGAVDAADGAVPGVATGG